MITIIIPIYNAERYLRHCIDSILAQTNPDFELLLIDDGSTDTTPTICAEYAARDTRIKHLQKPNGGASTARNLGIEQAQGEWITFIDADDTIEPEYLSVAGDHTADWILTNWETHWDDNRPADVHEVGTDLQYEGQEAIRQLWSQRAHSDTCRCPWGKFFRRSIINAHNVRFDPAIRYGEDTLFNYLYLQWVNSIRLQSTPQSHYIFHQSIETVAVQKYRCTPEGLVSVRDQVFDIFYGMQLSNLRFERLFFFCFTMIEHCYLHRADDEVRHHYYHHPTQLTLEDNCLSSLKCYDRWMYRLFKHAPHQLIRPLANIYLRYR